MATIYNQQKIELQGFRNLGENYDFSIVDDLEKSFTGVALGVLQILNPHEQFEALPQPEENTLMTGSWTKVRKKIIYVSKKGEQKEKWFAEISIEYSCLSTLDGDKWVLRAAFRHPPKLTNDFYFYSQSAYPTKKLCLGIYALPHQHLLEIEEFLNSYYNDNSKFEKDEF